MEHSKDKINTKKILFIMGTRPEVIKMAPVINAFRAESDKFETLVCNTAQHRDMTDQLCSFFGINIDFDLNVMKPNQRLLPLLSRLLNGLDTILEEHQIDGIIAQGDTMSVFSAGLSAFFRKIPFFHLEAGLRSYDMAHPFPEEYIRVCAAKGAALHLAPTEDAKKALLKEEVEPESVVVTGNTVVDAVLTTSRLVESIDTAGKDLVLVTVHRRENHGERLSEILEAIKELAQNYSNCLFVLPVHPNPNVKQVVHKVLGDLSNIHLVEPMAYSDLVAHLKCAKLVLSDSGGIQEEAPAFQCPVLVLRNRTERNEGIEAGFAQLVGADKSKIIESAQQILDQTFEDSRVRNAKNPYGDGKASTRVFEAIHSFYKGK